MGGGPGIRVHQFGGPRMRRRPPGTGQGAGPQANEPPRTALSALQNLLPLLILFVLPLLSSLFSGSSDTSSSFGSSSRLPSFHIDTPAPPLTHQHITHQLRVPYYVNPRDVEDYSSRKWRSLDSAVEQTLVRRLNYECDVEYRRRDQAIEAATGWFWADKEAMDQARAMPIPACDRLRGMTGRL